MSVQPASSPPGNLANQIVELLAKQPTVEGIEFDSAYFAQSPLRRDGSTATGTPSRVLLPREFRWRSPDADKPSVPLQLCEFLAYKTGLAYETPARIKRYLETCCEGIAPENSHFRFFDSTVSRKGDPADLSQARERVDAQGFGFVFERKAFVIFRGTQTNSDWAINSSDAVTGDLGGEADGRYRRLKKRYGPLLDRLGSQAGRHVGFAIAWTSLKDEVEDWLAEALENKIIDQIVYSGHSLGGAMAQLAAFDHAVLETGIERDRGIEANRIAAVVTFGAPAAGSKQFSLEYKPLLGNRTVLLESSGDLVPRIMQRWYYKMLYPLRQRVMAGVQMHQQVNTGFGKVVTPWSFASEPPLSNSDLDNALSGLREAATRLIEKAAADEKKKQEEERAKAEKAEREKAELELKDKDGKPAEPAAGTEKSAGASGGASQPIPAWVYWIGGFVVLAAAAGVVLYFVRRKLFSHDIEQRYALYLSTLSYQHLRAKHHGDLDLANQELEEHLRFVRGDMDSSSGIAKAILDSDNKPKPFYDSVQGLPVRIVREKANAGGNDPTQGTPALALVLVYRFLVSKLSGAGGKDQTQGSPLKVFELPQDPVFAEFLTKPDTFV